MKRMALALILVLVFLASSAYAAGNGEITYRALMIGVDGYQTNALTGCINDATRMSEMLLTANDAGAFYQSPTIRANLQTDEITALFREIQVWGADDDDVTMFYFAGHGYMSDKGTPAIVGKDNKMMRITELIELLDGVPGVKIVVLDCRYADSLVTDQNPSGALETYNQAVIDAFRNSPTAASFYVMSSCRLTSASTETENTADSYGLTAYYTTKGCGYDYLSKTETEEMPADTNENGAVSLGEIQQYVLDEIAKNNADATVNIKTFPESSAYPIMARRATTEVVEVTLPQSEMEIALGREYELEASIKPANASMRSMYWTSSDLSVVKVDEMGNIEGLKPGVATISVTTTNGLTESMTVNVTDTTFIEGIELNTGKLILAPNGHATLTASVEPENATEQINWTSLDETVASVDQNGCVTCNKIGETVVTASTQGGIEAACAISVVKADQVVRSIEVAKTELELFVGETRSMQYVVKPKNAMDTNVTFVSTDEEVLSISGGNVLNAVAPGECVVYATASSGASASIDVEVKSASIELNKKSLSLKKGKSANIKAAVKPQSTNTTINWESSDPAVATVDNGKVEAVSSGEAVITASLEDGTSAECTVVVDGTPVKNVKVRPQKLTVKAGETAQLEATVAPENATITQCQWKSSNEKVATVDENGLVTGVSHGTAVISAKTHNNKKAKALVKVTGTAAKDSADTGEAAQTDATQAKTESGSSELTLDQTDVELVAGLAGQNKITLTATLGSEETKAGQIKWVSSNPKVAAVNKKGVVIAKSEGKATIKAVTAKKKSATCNVTVAENVVLNTSPFSGTDKLLYSSAKRIYYKNSSTLVIDICFTNRTGEAVKAPEAGKLILMLTDGRVLDVKDISQGKNALKDGKVGVVSYKIKVKEGDELYGLDIRGAKAEIVKEGATPIQTMELSDTAAADETSEADGSTVPEVGTDVQPESVDDAYVGEDSFIDDPFNAGADWGDENGWDDTVMNTADFDTDSEA